MVAAPMVEQVLDRLGLDERPSADEAGLAALYRAWGERVSWDSVRKCVSFNHLLVARRNVEDEVVGWSGGDRVAFRADGSYERSPGDRKGVLVGELGYSEEIVDRIPAVVA